MAHIGKMMIHPHFSSSQMQLQDIYHISEKKKENFSISSPGNYILFCPNNVKVYQNIKIFRTPKIEGQRLESIYIMSAKFAS